MKLETERLILREIRLDDAEPMFRNWANDPKVTEHLTWLPHGRIEVTRERVARWVEEIGQPGIHRFVITIKDSDEPWGTIDVVNYHDGNPEIGYCLSSQKWNQGYMTEACKAFIDYLFSLGFKKVIIRANVGNIGSSRDIQKCGLKFCFVEKKEHCSEIRPEPVEINWYEIERS